MHDHNNDQLAYLAIPVLFILAAIFFVKSLIQFFYYLGSLFTAIGAAINGFGKFLIIFGALVSVAVIFGGLIYAVIYCVLRYVHTIKRITAFREEFLRQQKEQREYVNEQVLKMTSQFKKLDKNVNQFLEEFTKPPSPIAPVQDLNLAPIESVHLIEPANAQSNESQDTESEEIMISNPY